MSAYFITATGTDIGKTFVACQLIRKARAEGARVAALKPIMSGGDEDARRLLDALGEPATEEAIARIAPFRFHAPLSPHLAAAREGKTLSLKTVADSIASAIIPDGITYIEGAGGVMTPITARETMRDLMRACGLPAILVTGSYLGAISHTLTAIEALHNASVSLDRIFIHPSENAPMPWEELAESLRRFVSVPVLSSAAGA